MFTGLCFRCCVCSVVNQRGKRYSKKASGSKGQVLQRKYFCRPAERKAPPATAGRYVGPGPYGSFKNPPRERARVAEDIEIVSHSNDSTTYRASGRTATFVISNDVLARRLGGNLSNAPLYVLDTILKCKRDGEYTLMEHDGKRYHVGLDSMKRGGDRLRFIASQASRASPAQPGLHNGIPSMDHQPECRDTPRL